MFINELNINLERVEIYRNVRSCEVSNHVDIVGADRWCGVEWQGVGRGMGEEEGACVQNLCIDCS